MERILTALRDWWRGYSEEDVAAVQAKVRGPHRPGAIIKLTAREWRALRKHPEAGWRTSE